MFSLYPRKVEYWVCSDGRSFPSEKEAQDWEDCLEKMRNDPAFSSANSLSADKINPYEVSY